METLKAVVRARWIEILEDIAIGAALLILAFAIAGCVPGGMFMADPTMTPEQVETLQKIGYRAVRCATVAGGPPVGGRISSVTVPENGKAEVTFGPDCSVQAVKLLP